MRRVRVGWAAGILCLAGAGMVEATPLSAVSGLTTCIAGRSQQFCSTNGLLMRASGEVLPESLADIVSVLAVTGEGEVTLDRSAELIGDRLGDVAFGPVVVSPQMICSIQLSFDQRVDSSMRAARWTPAVKKWGTASVDRSQVELTLGTAMTSLEAATMNMNTRAMAKQDYVSFALVNQAHISAAPEPEEAVAEEGEEASPQ